MITNRLAKVAVAAVAVAAPLLTASAAFASTPDTIHPNGYAVVEGCSTFTGQITYAPGLLKTKLKQETASVTGTLSNCHNSNGAQDGTGTISGTLTGTSSLNSKNLSGTLFVNWPAGTGFSNTVSVTLRGANQGADTISGTITSGAYTTGIFQTTLLSIGNNPGGTGSSKHPVTSQTVVNTAPVNDLYNFG